MSGYQWRAEEYAAHSGSQQAWGHELIARLELEGDESILDIGCGDGRLTAALAARVPAGSVLGLDSSPDMIALARAQFPESGHPNLAFRLGDACALPFENRFDVVFSNSALHWIRDHRPLLAGVRRSLKPGGRMLVQMGGAGNMADLLAANEAVQSAPEWRMYFVDAALPFTFPDPADYRRLLAEARLAARSIDLYPRDLAEPGAEALKAAVRVVWMPILEHLPPEQHVRFIDQLIDRFAAEHPADEQGLLRVRTRRLVVDAVKEGC